MKSKNNLKNKRKSQAQIIVVILLILLILLMFFILYPIIIKIISENREVGAVQIKLLDETMDIEEVKGNLIAPEHLDITLHKGVSKIFYNISKGSPTEPPNIALITDVSASMEWCNEELETKELNTIWEQEGGYYCGLRRYLTGEPCIPKKIDKIIEAEKEFVDSMFEQASGSKIGIVEYSSGNTVKRIDLADLSSKLYIGPDPNCYEPNWPEPDIDDSSWEEFQLGRSIDASEGCGTYCKVLVRKKFNINSISEIKELKLKVSYGPGYLCFINGIEVGHYAWNNNPSYWNAEIDIPLFIVHEGENTIACASKGSSIALDIGLFTDKETLIDKNEFWKKIVKIDCGKLGSRGWNAKDVRARKGVQTNFTFHGTIKNYGKPITQPFKVNFYKDSISEANKIGEQTINSMSFYDLKSVKINYITTLTQSTNFYMVADNENVIIESDKENNQANIRVYVYDYIGGKDLIIDRMGGPTLCTTNPIPNQLLISAYILNQGSEDVTKDFEVTFFKESISSQNIIGSVRVTGGLKANKQETKIANFYWNVDDFSTNTKIYAYVDYPMPPAQSPPPGEIIESNEENNDKYITIKINKPDLTLNSWNTASYYNPPCSLGLNDASVKAYIYDSTCPSGPTDIALSRENQDLINGNWENYQEIPSIQPGKYGSAIFYNMIVDITDFKIPTKFWVKADSLNQVDESNELNNIRATDLYAGPDILFDNTIFTTSPKIVNKGEQTDINFYVRYGIIQCTTTPFSISFYKNSISSKNLIGSIRITTTTPTRNKLTSYKWTTTLEEDTNIIAVLDSGDEVPEYNEENNIATVRITLEDPSLEFFLTGPLLFSLPSSLLNSLLDNSIFLANLGTIIDTCPPGIDTNLYSQNIVRTNQLVGDEKKDNLKDFINQAETWWGTCICCGIAEAETILTGVEVNTGNAPKIAILMTDGAPDEGANCNGLGLNGHEAAINAACNAYTNNGIIIYTIGVGGDVDEDLLKTIAGEKENPATGLKCGNGSYYSAGDVNQITEVYKEITKDISSQYKPLEVYDHLKFIFYNDSISYEYRLPFSELPKALETQQVQIPLNPSTEGFLYEHITDITRIEIYPVMYTKSGKQVIGQMLDSWEIEDN